MKRMTQRFEALLVFSMLISCRSPEEKVREDVLSILKNEKGTFAVAFHDISTGTEILINETEGFHAASTMKTPVLIEAYHQASEGKFALSDSILIKNEFHSIADGSPYSLQPVDDSELELYSLTGQKRSLSDILHRMIVVSSNLATNLMIEKLGADNVTQRMRSLGANDIKILRGVEDLKAYRQNLNNTTTAHDLMLIFKSLATGQAVNSKASKEMINVLLEQQYNDIIPFYLPADVKVAHKTGWTTGIEHDSGIVFLPGGRKYVLILLSKGLEDKAKGKEVMARISEKIYKFMIETNPPRQR